MIKMFTKSLLALAVITLVCIAYTAVVTAVGQTFFTNKANGSLISEKKTIKGSALIAQPFTSKKYLWGRQMSITLGNLNGVGGENNTMYSAASQLSPSSRKYQTLVKSNDQVIKWLNPAAKQAVPVDLLTDSGSGLDPEISLQAARYQVKRIAAARKLSQASVQKVINNYTKNRTFGILGEPRVNVLEVNLALDKISS